MSACLPITASSMEEALTIGLKVKKKKEITILLADSQ